jgi:hypothetical protein
MNRIPIHEARKKLPYKDRRSFKRWCDNNGVEILSDNGSNKRYILQEEFEEALERKGIEHLNNKDKLMKKKNGYTPMGDHEKKFLSILTGKTSEL